MIVAPPDRFSWIEKPFLAALARPDGPEEFAWLRHQGIQLLVSLTENPPRRDWINDAGLMLLHVPIVDMDAPTQDQLDQATSALIRARDQKLGAAVHCAAGMGRTGTILAAYLVAQGYSALEAIVRIRELRPGSIETEDQEQAVIDFARRRAGGSQTGDDVLG